MSTTDKAYDEITKVSGRLLSKGISKGDLGLALLRVGSIFLIEHGGIDLLERAMNAILETYDSPPAPEKKAPLTIVR